MTTAGALTPGKTSFNDIYDDADPRAYYHGLGAFDYAAPHHAQQVFRQVIDALPSTRPRVVDLCCSYGINAALLKTDLDLSDLYDRYRSEDLAGLSSEELAELDREFYAGAQLDEVPQFVGLDTASNAVDYAVSVGLLEQGMAQNLEVEHPSSELATAMSAADLITVSGGIGYITERSFDRLLACADAERKPWIAALCLRTVPFEPIADRLASQGLVTEHLDGVTLPQRRFTSAEEKENALSELDALGLEATGREAEGSYHVNIFLARPAEDADSLPLDEIVVDLSDAVEG